MSSSSVTSTCPSCQRSGVRLRPAGVAGRVCAACEARSRHEICTVCGELRDIRRRNPDGTATCKKCVARAIAEAVRTADRDAIGAVIATVEPDLLSEAIAAAVQAAARDTRQLRHLADALAGEPDCLVSGSSSAPREVDRLIAALVDMGATRVQRLRCAVCGRDNQPLVGRVGRRVCARCDQAGRVDTCGSCGKVRRVAGRQGDGAAVCDSCVAADRSRWKLCSSCGELGRACQRKDGQPLCRRCYRLPEATCGRCGRVRPCRGVRDGQPLCEGCYPRRKATCSSCGRVQPVIVVWAAGPVCSNCYQETLAAKGTCEQCGQRRRIDPRDTSGRQLCSDCAGLPALSVCEACGREDRIWRNRRCFTCILADRLDELLAGPNGTIPCGLTGLRNALGGVNSPRAMLRWLDQPRVAAVLSGLASGQLTATHETIDALGDRTWVDHLRQVLVASGVLPERNEVLARLETWVAAQLGAINNAEDRHLVDMFATWSVLRRRRARLVRRPAGLVDHDHDVISGAIRLLAWLRDHDRSLATCTQADIDLWLASGPPSRQLARTFLRWARRRRLVTDVDMVRPPDGMPAASNEVAELAAFARRLLADDSLALVDRVAGLLLLLYGQPLTRIVGLTVDRIGRRDGITTLRLGTTDIELPEPLAVLVQDLAATRPMRGALDVPGSPWLFPGGRAGQALSANQLGLRLNALGIHAQRARTTVLLELAGEIAPHVIADMLGLHHRTAVRWGRAAAGDWNGYAARRVQTEAP